MKIICIYCKKASFEIGAGSKEHVILSALGGKKASRNICCVACNRRLGNEIDEPLTHGLRYLSNLCGIKTDRNKEAASIRNAGHHDNREYDLISGGKNQPSRAHIAESIDEKSGKVSISISGRNENHVKNLLNQKLKKFGKNIEDIEIIKAVETVKYPESITIDIDVGLKTQLRSIAKTALTYLATLTSPDRIRSPAFKEVIEYIDGANDSDKFVYLTKDNFPKTRIISKTQHRVLICASNSHKRAIGLVELFGGIKFKVVISDNWDGPDLYKGYTVDGVSGIHEQDELSLLGNENIIFGKFLHLPENEYIESFSEAMSRVYEVHVKGERKRIIKEVIEKFCKTHGGKDFSDDLAMELSSKIAKAVSNNLFRINEEIELEI